MQNSETAYRLLGLDKNATRDEIEDRYYILCRRDRAIKNERGLPETDIEEITKAYDFLTRGDKSKVCGTEKSGGIKNFFYYHKWKFVAGFFAALMFAFLLKDVLAPPPDIKILVLGEIRLEDTGELEELVEESKNGAKRVSVDQISYLGTDLLVANQRKELVLTAAGEIDIFVLDRSKFEEYADKGLFLDLGPYEDALDAVISDKTPYALDISGGIIPEKLKIEGIESTELMGAVNAQTKRTELALEVLKMLAH